MKKMIYNGLLLFGTCLLAGCAATSTPSAVAVNLTRTGLPNPACVSQNGASFAPSSISVSRNPAPSYPNTNVQASFGSSGTSSMTLILTPPNGINLSWGTRSVSGKANADGSASTQTFPLLVSASPSQPSGQYVVKMQYNSDNTCPMASLTVTVN